MRSSGRGHARTPSLRRARPAGVRHVVLERAAALTQHPQAHFINHRTMEVGPKAPAPAARLRCNSKARGCNPRMQLRDAKRARAARACQELERRLATPPQVLRHIGGLNAQVSSASPPLGQWRRFVYCESMTGEVLGEVDHFPGAPRLAACAAPAALRGPALAWGALWGHGGVSCDSAAERGVLPGAVRCSHVGRPVLPHGTAGLHRKQRPTVAQG